MLCYSLSEIKLISFFDHFSSVMSAVVEFSIDDAGNHGPPGSFLSVEPLYLIVDDRRPLFIALRNFIMPPLANFAICFRNQL